MIVILYIMDSLRPDFLSCYGYDKETSPNIDKIAEAGVMFTNAFAQATWTRPSCASILTATYPSTHGVMSLEDELPQNIPTFIDSLKKGGFSTAAFSSLVNVSTGFGFGRGFDNFIELFAQEILMEKRVKLPVRGTDRELHCKLDTDYVPLSTSEDINSSVIPFIENISSSNTFILIWSMDTHGPYFHRDVSLARFAQPAEDLWRPGAVVGQLPQDELNRVKSIYADMVYHNDYHIGVLVERLKELGVYDETFFILTGDHGEAFGEHGLFSHGREPYDEQIKVPLIMKFPGSQPKGRIAGLAQHIDIGPTILDYVGLNEDIPFQGKSLLPMIHGGSEVNDYIFAEHHYTRNLPRFTAIRTKEHKYIEITSGEMTTKTIWKDIFQRTKWLIFKPRMLFSLKEDPMEKSNIYIKEQGLAKRFHKIINTILRNSLELGRGLKRGKKKREDLDEGVVKQLNALGYFD